MVDFQIKERYNVQDLERVMELLRAPGGCGWSSRNMKAPRGELGVELDLGQQLPEAGVLSGQLAERSLHPQDCHPAFLSSFLAEARLLAMAGSGCPQFFAQVSSSLLAEVADLTHGVQLSADAESFFSNSKQRASFLNSLL